MKSSKFQIGDRVKWKGYKWYYGTVTSVRWSGYYNALAVSVRAMSLDGLNYTINEKNLTLVLTAIDKLDEIL